MLFMQFRNRWSVKDRITPEQHEFVRANWPGYSDKADDSFDIPYGKVRVTWDEYRLWTEAGFDMEIEACKSMMLGKKKDIAGDPNDGPDAQFLSGKLFNITLPDIGLLLINEVTWLENACTEDLQRELDEGWRILAVCPPNAQRRPDYILGRRKS